MGLPRWDAEGEALPYNKPPRKNFEVKPGSADGALAEYLDKEIDYDGSTCVCCSILQCGAVWCSVVQLWCSVVQIWCSVVPYVSVRCSLLRSREIWIRKSTLMAVSACVAAFCSVVHCGAVVVHCGAGVM